MRPANGDAPATGPTIDAGAVVQDLLPIFADAEVTVRVVEDDTVVGVVDRRAVMRALIEERT
jgi:hypothetical protein